MSALPKQSDDLPSTPDLGTSIEFLKKLRPGGAWVLTAIIPDGATETITAKTEKAVADFINRNDGKKNIYYSVNPTRKAMRKKAAKTDISAIEFLLSDLDPNEGESADDAKARYLAKLENQQPASTAVIDSGNGIQVLWRLAEPIELAEPITKVIKNSKGEDTEIVIFSDETMRQIEDVEARVKTLMESMGSVAGTQNIDRILRLPGTTNIPNAKKLKAGRVPCPTRLIKFNGSVCRLDDFPRAEQQKQKEEVEPNPTDAPPPTIEIDWAKVGQYSGWLKTVADLPTDFNVKGRMIVDHTGKLDDLNTDIRQAGLIEKPYGSWSEVSMALTSIFKADRRYTVEQIAAALLCDLECNKNVTKQPGDSKKRRAVERLLNRSHESNVTRIAQALDWRECRENGMPLASVHNAMLAITAIGIECSHDIFHNTYLVGFKDDDVRHEFESVGSEISDNVILRLRHILSNKYGIDFQAGPTRDAMLTLALDHCFDPICDMLDQAEADWDGIERLDEMAVTYFKGADTPLNRAIVRKTMIAAVRRARHPGCKFDNITVLEGPEGWNKSTAWRILAGDENFSDQSILGIKEKEVQELLGPVWIHESSDLSGMRKADVESVKAFASRQVDIARPAFGHFVKRQKRHAINTGTTNGDEYLQSQTGNRRFWPFEVLEPIDIENLVRDRLKLWGEAAKLESAGESLIIPKELWEAAEAAQEKRRTKDPWENIVADIPKDIEGPGFERITIVHVETDRELVSSFSMLTYVLRIPVGLQKTAESMRLSTVMKRAGWERTPNKVTIDGKQVRGYFRWRKEPEQPAGKPGSGAQNGQPEEGK